MTFKNNFDSSDLFIPVSILVGSIIIAGAIMTGANKLAGPLPATALFGAPAGAQAQQAQQGQQAGRNVPDASKVSARGEPYVGSIQAPVTIAYWFDYQCPFCQRNEENALGTIVKEYAASGKVRIIFKDFEFLGPDSQTLGIYGRAVWEAAPDKFYAWHKAIFDNQGQENSGWATKDKIMSVTTGALGADTAARVADLVSKNSARYAQALAADKTEAADFGVRSTPTTLIGTKALVGALPYEQFKAAIDTALAGK